MRLFLFVCLFPVLLCAYEAESDWRDSASLVEVWGAYQKSLQGKGVGLNANYVGAVAGNLTGGREQGGCYADYFSATSKFDLEKLLEYNNLKFYNDVCVGHKNISCPIFYFFQKRVLELS